MIPPEAIKAFQLAENGFGERMQTRGILFDPALGVEAGLLAALPHLLPSGERGKVDLPTEMSPNAAAAYRLGYKDGVANAPAQAAQVDETCSHEAWEENGGWCKCADCGHGWHAPTAEPVAQGEAVASWVDALAEKWACCIAADHFAGPTLRQCASELLDAAYGRKGPPYSFVYGLGRTQPRAVPDGMVLVPREPTDAMKDAGYAESAAHRGSIAVRRCWAAMIAAAPSPEVKS